MKPLFIDEFIKGTVLHDVVEVVMKYRLECIEEVFQQDCSRAPTKPLTQAEFYQFYENDGMGLVTGNAEMCVIVKPFYAVRGKFVEASGYDEYEVE